jgi:hypothetical protein
MGKHGEGKALPQKQEPPPKVAEAHKRAAAGDTAPPPPAPAAPAPSSGSKLEHAARRVLAALPPIADHLEHTPACPSGGGGPCVCGRNELLEALGRLKTALEGAPR